MAAQLQEEDTPDALTNEDLLSCLLLWCDYPSLVALRAVAARFAALVPATLASAEWLQAPQNRASLRAVQWQTPGEVVHQALCTPRGRTMIALHCPTEEAWSLAQGHGASLDRESGFLTIELEHPVGFHLPPPARLLAGTPFAPFVPP